jgi:hypothetical protein
MESNFEYYAFISYKREDGKYARWLQHQLESYRLPVSLRKTNPDIPKRLKIFRDETDLGVGVLSDKIREGLDSSRFLIVICSPRSAREDCYVTKEIAYFLRNHPVESIALTIVEGTPYAGDESECFNPEIKKLPDELELNAANVQKTGKRIAFIQVLAYLLGIDFTLLWGRHKKYLLKKRIYTISIILVTGILVLTSVFFSLTLNVVIRLKEQQIHSLPFEGATVSLECAGRKEIRTVSEKGKDSLICFPLHSKHIFNDLKLVFESDGYRTIDTVISWQKEIVLPLYRDDSYTRVEGIVYDFDNYLKIPDAKVIINDTFEIWTNDSGYFRYDIPLQYQTTRGSIRIEKESYQTYSDSFTTIVGNGDYPLERNH